MSGWKQQVEREDVHQSEARKRQQVGGGAEIEDGQVLRQANMAEPPAGIASFFSAPVATSFSTSAVVAPITRGPLLRGLIRDPASPIHRLDPRAKASTGGFGVTRGLRVTGPGRGRRVRAGRPRATGW